MITLFNIRPKGLNVGNDVISVAMRHLLGEAFPEGFNLVTLPATTRYESRGLAGLTAKSVYEINQYAHGVIVGGGNLYENNELDVDPTALGALGVPLMLYSLSMGRIYDRSLALSTRTDSMPAATMRALSEHALVNLARDRATVELLTAAGVENAELGGCPTIFLDEVYGSDLPVVPTIAGAAIVSIRDPGLMNVPPRIRQRVHAEVEAIIRFLREQGKRKVLILCHDHRDIPFATSFQDVEFIYTADAGEYLRWLRSADLVVTYRLHAFLPCLSIDKPCINIAYDERALSPIADAGFGDWNIDMALSDDVVGDVKDRFHRLEEFGALRKAAAGRWKTLREAQADGMARFAAAARDSLGRPTGGRAA